VKENRYDAERWTGNEEMQEKNTYEATDYRRENNE
jgi:hypothetical protein